MACAMKAAAVNRPAFAHRATVARPAARFVAMRSSPVDAASIDAAIKEAEDACKTGDTAECAVAWDTVEELDAARSHAQTAAKADPKASDPLEQFCADDPSADECRVYED